MRRNPAFWKATMGLASAMTVTGVLGDEPRFKPSRVTTESSAVLRSSDGNLELNATIGQTDAGVLTGGTLELSGGFWFGVSPTDCDEDGSVGYQDFWRLTDCITGPDQGMASGCRCLDVDRSGYVDLRDFAAFQRAFNDATAPPSLPGLTTVDGYVQFADGSPVVGAAVHINDQPDLTAVTNAKGRYIILDAATTFGLIHIKAAKQISGGILATGAATGLEPCANGITDAGVITIAAHGADADGDKLPDALEPELGYDPSKPDTDGNGIIDGLEDFDGDGVANCLEVALGTDLAAADTDDDFLDDAQELEHRTNPLIVDTDEDGIIDGEEVEFGSDPLNAPSLPAVVLQRFGHAFGWLASAEQLSVPATNVPTAAAFAPVAVSLENAAAPPPLNVPSAGAFGPDVSVDNQHAP